jgi:hypothetical protein
MQETCLLYLGQFCFSAATEKTSLESDIQATPKVNKELKVGQKYYINQFFVAITKYLTQATYKEEKAY